MLPFISKKVYIPIALVCQAIQEFLVTHEDPREEAAIHLTPFKIVANKVD